MKPSRRFRIDLIPIENGKAFEKVASYLYDRVSHTNLPMPDKNTYINRCVEIIKSRVYAPLFSEATYIHIEQQYNEDAWKDMVSLYYVHTFPNISTRSMRVHLFNWSKDYIDISEKADESKSEDYRYVDENVNECYLGYFNLRPVNNATAILSYVMPNYSNLTLKTEDGMLMNMLTYRRSVHLSGITLRTEVFPFFAGESIVAVCAHCCLIMLSRYMYRRMRMPEISLKDICTVDQQRVYPSYGLSLKNIFEIFSNHHIVVRAYTGSTEPRKDVYTLQLIRDIVFSLLDSHIPVLLAFNSHVILLCGATDGDENSDRYVSVYDDSGAFVGRLGETKKIIEMMRWGTIESACKSINDKEIHAIAPMYPRISLDYPTLKVLLDSDEVKDLQDFQRAFLLDCNKTKALLLQCLSLYGFESEKVNNAKGKEKEMYMQFTLLSAIIEHFLHSDTSHYYWWVEYKSGSSSVHNYLIVDTVKTASLHITEYSINFAKHTQEVTNIARGLASENGYGNDFEDWLQSKDYQFAFIPLTVKADQATNQI